MKETKNLHLERALPLAFCMNHICKCGPDPEFFAISPNEIFSPIDIQIKIRILNMVNKIINS